VTAFKPVCPYYPQPQCTQHTIHLTNHDRASACSSATPTSAPRKATA
jgi:hypothetical protein